MEHTVGHKPSWNTVTHNRIEISGQWWRSFVEKIAIQSLEFGPDYPAMLMLQWWWM
jgi:hypothetical protein